MSEGLNRVLLFGNLGADRAKKISARRLDVLTGRRFGRWTVGARSENDKQGKPQWECLCDCGNRGVVRSASLRSGCSFSCGCAAAEATSARSQTHGKTNSREFETWMRIKRRCHPTNKDYGGRGIRVCSRWLESFENFLADMGLRPPGHSIDRKDVNGNYEPGNCRWATTVEQNRNKRSNVRITARGRTQLAADWARETGISQTTIGDRLRRGVPVDQAVTAKKLGGAHG